MAVMGVHLYQESRHQWAQLRTQRAIVNDLLNTVLTLRDTNPPFDTFQAFYFMAMSCTYTNTLVPARRYLEKCQDMIKSEGYGLDPTWIDASLRASPCPVIDNRPSEYSEEKHEMVSILVNLMYLQCMHCILYGECHGLFADLEAQLPDFAVRCPLLTFLGHIAETPFLSGLIQKFSNSLRWCSGSVPSF